MLTLALLASQQAMALKVYQWTDEEGVVHYSDTPPPGEAPSAINEIEMVNMTGNGAASDEYSIVNQLERMIAWRRQAEEDQRAWKQLELEEERLALEREASRQAAAVISTDTYYPYSYYPRAYSYYPFTVNYPRYTRRYGHHFPQKHFDMDNKGHHGHITTRYNQLR